MSFFKDLKEDIAQSVNELAESLDDGFADTGENEVTPDLEVNPDTLLENESFAIEGFPKEEEPAVEEIMTEEEPVIEENLMEEEQETEEIPMDEAPQEEEIPMEEQPVVEEILMDEELPEEIQAAEEFAVSENDTLSEEEIDMDTLNEEVVMPEAEEDTAQEVTVITKGTTINGGIKSDTSLVVKGTIEGDVECQGKLTITGRVAGNTIASEIYVNTPRLEGDINSKGIVKIDVGTVVIGNISCTSVLVSGAVKGNIEVNGPVIVDSTAVVKGDIKAKSIQINSGAVIDGHCSLQFADVDLDSFFE